MFATFDKIGTYRCGMVVDAMATLVRHWLCAIFVLLRTLVWVDKNLIA